MVMLIDSRLNIADGINVCGINTRCLASLKGIRMRYSRLHPGGGVMNGCGYEVWNI